MMYDLTLSVVMLAIWKAAGSNSPLNSSPVIGPSTERLASNTSQQLQRLYIPGQKDFIRIRARDHQGVPRGLMRQSIGGWHQVDASTQAEEPAAQRMAGGARC